MLNLISIVAVVLICLLWMSLVVRRDYRRMFASFLMPLLLDIHNTSPHEST